MRHVLSISICCAGFFLAWLSQEFSGLLIAVVGVSIYGGRRVSLLSAAVMGFAIIVVIAMIGWNSVIENEANFRLADVLAVGLGVSGLIYFNQITGFWGHNESQARMIVESMPGHGWAADPNGKFIYV